MCIGIKLRTPQLGVRPPVTTGWTIWGHALFDIGSLNCMYFIPIVCVIVVISLQTSGRHVAHYHCVVCSSTIARKTDMISHLKRHVNKGETEASYSGNWEMLCDEPGKANKALFVMKILFLHHSVNLIHFVNELVSR